MKNFQARHVPAGVRNSTDSTNSSPAFQKCDASGYLKLLPRIINKFSGNRNHYFELEKFIFYIVFYVADVTFPVNCVLFYGPNSRDWDHYNGPQKK